MNLPYTLPEFLALEHQNISSQSYLEQIIALCKKNTIKIKGLPDDAELLKSYAFLLTYLDDKKSLTGESYSNIYKHFFAPFKNSAGIKVTKSLAEINSQLVALLETVKILHREDKLRVTQLQSSLTSLKLTGNAKSFTSISAKPRVIIIGDTRCCTKHIDFYSLSIDEKISKVREALEALHAKISSNAEIDISKQLQGILIMPEYFFANSNAAGESRQYSEEEARTIEVKLAKLSKEYPHILIAAPSAFKKPIFYNDQRSDERMSPEKYQEDKIARGITSGDHAKFVAKKQENLARYQKLVSFSQTANIGEDSQSYPMQLSSALYRLDELNNSPDKKDDFQLSRTTVRFFLNGLQVGKFHKRAGFEEILDRANIFLPGNAFPELVIDNLHIGVEICYEHDLGMLKKSYQERQKNLADAKAAPDIHLLFSACVLVKEDSISLENGFFLHSTPPDMGLIPIYQKHINAQKSADLSIDKSSPGIHLIELKFDWQESSIHKDPIQDVQVETLCALPR